MSLDDLQKTWQSQEPVRLITVGADVLLREVRRNHQRFRAEILWRDVREVAIALVCAPLFVLWTEWHSPEIAWSIWLIAAAMLAVAGFLLVDRYRQRRKGPSASDTLVQWAESSLADLEHQIWLLRNVFWWYLLPLGAALAAFFGYVTWQCRGFWLNPVECWGGLLIVLAMWIGLATLLYFVYRLNQRWVQKEGLPRQQELRELVESLTKV
jgi:hypothetical protein